MTARPLSIVVALAALTIAQNRDAGAARRAAPSVIVFSGAPLRAPIVLTNWSENERLMTGAAVRDSIPDSALKHRLSIQTTMYWGAEWARYAATPDSLVARIREAQPGAYYPATGREPAVWVFGPVGPMPGSQRLLSPEGVAILRAHHLPHL